MFISWLCNVFSSTLFPCLETMPRTQWCADLNRGSQTTTQSYKDTRKLSTTWVRTKAIHFERKLEILTIKTNTETKKSMPYLSKYVIYRRATKTNTKTGTKLQFENDRATSNTECLLWRDTTHQTSTRRENGRF